MLRVEQTNLHRMRLFNFKIPTTDLNRKNVFHSKKVLKIIFYQFNGLKDPKLLKFIKTIKKLLAHILQLK